ncbi:hypothetical protein TKK_0002260 [Trichogramma kaykai]
MISKTRVNNILTIINKFSKAIIAKETNKSEMFSIQVDSTQDITSKDQCSIILRYLNTDQPSERLLGVVQCTDSSGESIKNLVIKERVSNNIDFKKCIGSSTDGASNMRGEYKGFQAWLAAEIPSSVHVWCYAHILNLVISDTISESIFCVSLFGLLNKTAAFFKESYVRMEIWESILAEKDRRRLNLIGETRGWAKDAALVKIFGTSGHKEYSLLVDLLIIFEATEANSKTKPDARSSAKAFREAFLKYESILTAFVLRALFDQTTHLSKYLQTDSLDILKAFNMVKSTIKNVEKIRDEFKTIKEEADQFIKWAN